MEGSASRGMAVDPGVVAQGSDACTDDDDD